MFLSLLAIGPLQWSHVFSDMVSRFRRCPCVQAPGASMEPCLFRHGKGTFRSHVAACNQLQWSHVFSDMVRIEDKIKDADREVASMEPCLFRHGKTPGSGEVE